MTMPRHHVLDKPDSSDRPFEDRTIIDLPLEVKAGGLPGEFEGYGAVFGNTDRDGDVVAKGAFADSLKARLPALLWQHNAKEPIGRFDVVREDNRGLFVKGRLAQSGRGAEAYELLKMGALNGLSIGFVTKEAMRNSAAGTRTIKRADLMEVSLVTFPANELARVQTVKQKTRSLDANFETGDINDPRTFERFLREQGFSRNRAKAITAKGFKGSEYQPDRGNEIAKLVYDLNTRQGWLETKKGGLIGDILGGAVSGFAQGLTETMLSRHFERKGFEEADKMLRDFEVKGRSNRSKHTVELTARGDGKLLMFPMDHKKSRLNLSISMAGRERVEDHKIKAILRYPSWSKNSVKRERLDIDSSNYQGVIREQITVGAGTAITAWLASITDNKFRQAKSELAGRGWPELWLEYDGSRMGANIKSAKFAVTLQ